MTSVRDLPESQSPPTPPPSPPPKKRAPKKKPVKEAEKPLAVKKVEPPKLKKKGYESCVKRCREDIKKIEYPGHLTLKAAPFARIKEAYLQIYCANDQVQHDMVDAKGKKTKRIVKAIESASLRLNSLLTDVIKFCSEDV
jgi:hypothetical protein